ncbi:hypothetical protein [Bradyrhizobium nanningense]|nr:hypothetical protein [Bradyrhizobium nanningense]
MNIADDYRRAAEEIEKALEMSTLIRLIVWTVGLLALLRLVALYLPW